MKKHVKRLGKELFRLLLVTALVLPTIGAGLARADPGWYNPSWQCRKLITIDHTKVAANLTDFPVLINILTDSDLANDAQTDGDDILFTSSDGTTKLNHEIEMFETGAGELVVWVRIPGLSATSNTTIYMYYDNSAASNQENITGTWDSNYVAVWHLKEDPSGSAPQMLDSTANNHDGTTEGSWSSSNQVSGLIDGTLNFNSGIDKVKAGTFDVVGGGSGDDGITLETWFYSREERDGRFISKATGTDTQQHYWMLNALVDCPYRLRFRLKTDGTTTLLLAEEEHTVPLNQWIYAAGTYDGSAMRIYQDSTQVASTSKTGTISTNNSVKVAIGNQPPGAGSRLFKGLITEVRVSNIARSPEWLETSYNNHKYPDKAVHGAAGFFSLGAEESPPSLPTVTTDSATLVEETTATLNGTITDDGGEACQYRFEYGTVSGGPYPNNTGWTGSKTTGQSFTADITGLDEGTKYYFIAQAKNSVGTDDGSEMDFLTKPEAPTSLTGTAVSGTQINVSWTKGDGADRTMLRRKEGSYPSDRNDGDQVYFANGTSVSDTGLSPDTTYFYKAWSEVTGSQQWSDGYASTSASTSGGGPPPTAVGGIVYPVNKAQILLPWLLLFAGLSVAIARGSFYLRKKRLVFLTHKVNTLS
ncbi:DUF2341 domain-containing protein [Chloroflexota bacterium]